MYCLAKFLGKFATIFHDVTGEAYAVADNKILIKVFFYKYYNLFSLILLAFVNAYSGRQTFCVFLSEETLYVDNTDHISILILKTILQGFSYDGEGPDAFFLAGTSGTRPSTKGES